MKVALLRAFLTFSALGMTMAFASGGCQQEDRPMERRLRLCNLALAAAAVSPFHDPMFGTHLERGLLRASLGRPGAEADLDQAIMLATDGTSWSFAVEYAQTWMRERFAGPEARVAREPQGSVARRLWIEAVERSDHPWAPSDR